MADKILCPTDFSAGSQHALRVAIRLAVERDAELVIAHAWYVPPLAFAGEAPFPADTIQLMIRDAKQELADAAHDATTLGARHVSTQFLTGLPWDQIVQLVRDDPAYELVVMGTQGRTGVARVLLGSVTEKVVRHAPCSVLAVRAHDSAAPFSRMLVPIDFSDPSRDAIAVAGELAAHEGAEIMLLHVVDVPHSYRRDASMADYLATVDRTATRLLEERANELRTRSGVTVATRVEIGSPVARALAVLDSEPEFDLVVVGSHGRTGARRMVLGSVAERIVRHAACPVLVARAPRSRAGA